MSHEALRDKLLDLAYGELSSRDARKVEAHAAECDSCRAELDRIRETRRLMAALPKEAAPERGENVLLAAARERSRLREPSWHVPRWLLGASVAASFVAVAAVSYRIIAMRPGPLGTSEHEVLLGEARLPQEAGPSQTPGSPPSPAPAPEDKGSERAVAATLPPARRGEMGEKHKSAEPEPFRDRDSFGIRGAPPEASKPAAALRDEAFAKRSAPEAAEARALREEAPDDRAAAAPFALAAPEAEAPERLAPAAPQAKRERSGAKAAAPPATELPELGYARAPESRAEAPRAATRGDMAAGAVAPPAAPEDAIARWESLRASGRLRTEVRTFSGCEPDGPYDPHHFRESFRKLERDPQGRVVRYEMRGTIEGAPFEAEAFYDAAGVLRVERWRSGSGRQTESRHPAGGPTKTRFPARASGARIDAPGVCDN